MDHIRLGRMLIGEAYVRMFMVLLASSSSPEDDVEREKTGTSSNGGVDAA